MISSLSKKYQEIFVKRQHSFLSAHKMSTANKLFEKKQRRVIFFSVVRQREGHRANESFAKYNQIIGADRPFDGTTWHLEDRPWLVDMRIILADGEYWTCHNSKHGYDGAVLSSVSFHVSQKLPFSAKPKLFFFYSTKNCGQFGGKIIRSKTYNVKINSKNIQSLRERDFSLME